MNRYRFDIADSNDGPVGAAGVVYAETEEEAVTLLRQLIHSQTKYGECCVEVVDDGRGYLNVYLNPDAITTAYIFEVEKVEEEPA